MSETTVQLPFLGKRDYLHGTTLYRCLLKHLPQGASVCFRIPRVIKTNRIKILPQSAAKIILAPAAAKLNWRLGEANGSFSVYPQDISFPIYREKYDETLIDRIAEIRDKTVAIAGPSPFDVVGSAVPMFKILLKTQDLTPDGGQWMFSRLDLIDSNEDFHKIELVLIDARKELVAKSQISLDGKIFGEMYFSWVKENPGV